MKEYFEKLWTQLKKTTWRHIVWFIPITIAKVIGRFWVFRCIDNRAKHRSIVYNYVLQNNIPLKRLRERHPAWDSSRNGWLLQYGPHRFELRHQGFVAFRKVSRWQFWWTVFVYWGWLDDDSNQDTTDTGYIMTLLPDGDRCDHPLARAYGDHYLALFTSLNGFEDVVFGNAFDLGDTRAAYPFYDRLCTKAWNDRNTAMNVQYLLLRY